MQEQKVIIGGIEHIVQVTEQDAEARGLKKPVTKKAPAPINKASAAPHNK